MTRALFVATCLACLACAAPARPAATTLPDVELRTTAGERARLADVAGGRPLVIDLFATWCEPCRAAVPEMTKLAADHAGGDLVVVGVDVGEGVATVRRFVEETGIAYPVYLDPDFQLADSLGTSKVPTLLVVDREGRIVHRAIRLDDRTRAVITRLTK